MSALILHLLAGLAAGTMFGVQTLLMMALVVFGEGVTSLFLNGPAVGLGWLLTSQLALQIGYLGGMYLRSVLERVGTIIAVQSGRRS